MSSDTGNASDGAESSMWRYLLGIVGLATASVGLMYAFFHTGSGFRESAVGTPLQAVRSDPFSLVLLLSSLVFVTLLFVFLVVYGARTMPESPERE